MSLLARRLPEKFHFATAVEASACIEIFAKHNQLIRVMDAIDEAVTLFPAQAVPFLAFAHDFYQTQQDASRYHTYQARIFDFGIQPDHKVLDMGSGHIPFSLATHLADISTKDSSIGRGGASFKLMEGKPVYECAVENTPFADKEFDFVYCSHVLEHSPDPARACKELMRIARRGYIETPTRGKDVFLASARPSNHLNAVELRGDVLTFFPYSPDEIQGLHVDILQQMHSTPQTPREKAFSALLYLYPQAVNTMLLWENDFLYDVSCAGGSAQA